MGLFDKIDKLFEDNKIDRMLEDNKLNRMLDENGPGRMFEKNKFDEALDEKYEYLVENNPVTRKAKATIDESAREITNRLEYELYGKAQGTSLHQPSMLEDGKAVMDGWDSMMDQLMEKELAKAQIDPYCTCPNCGTKNKILDLHCVNCGQRLTLVPEAQGELDKNPK